MPVKNAKTVSGAYVVLPAIENLEGRQLMSVSALPTVQPPTAVPRVSAANPGTSTTLAQPSIRFTSPGNGAASVAISSPIEADLNLPNSAVNAATISSNTVYLYRTSDQSLVPAVVNTSGGGDSIILTPSATLAPNTQYTFVVTSGVADTSGASFIPYSMTFTTGVAPAQVDPSIVFQKVNLPSATGAAFTCVKLGTDGMLYASTAQGLIYRWSVGADDTLGTPQIIDAVQQANGGNRLITGFAFDPSSTPTHPVLWISNSYFALSGATTGVDLTGKISVLSLTNGVWGLQDAVVGLPRSVADHSTEQPVFGPGPLAGHNYLYFAQASNTAYGAPDSTWGNRPEHLLTAAVLRLDTTNINLSQGPLNVITPDVGGTYNPYPTASPQTDPPLILYATGVRNAFSMLWTQNGQLLAVNNGSSAGGAAPAFNSTDPSQINGKRIDTGGNYAGPNVPGIPVVQQTENDYLYNIKQNGYYGHPDPYRGEYVLDGGNPTTGGVADEVFSGYLSGTNPDSNYRGAAWDFGPHASADSIIEYQDKSFGGALQGALLVTEYSAGSDIVALGRDSAGNVNSETKGITGLTNLHNPLSLVEDNNTGNLFVTEMGGQRIELLRAVKVAGHASADKTLVAFNSIAKGYTGAASSPAQSVTITNTGAATLTFTAGSAFSIVADPSAPSNDSATFSIANASGLPTLLAAGQSATISIVYTANSAGLQYGRLQVNSNDPNGPLYVSLHGIGTQGVYGKLEPSLVQVLRAYNIPTIVGDGLNDANGNSSNTQYPIVPDASSTEVAMQRLQKAGPGAVTITPLASFNSAVQPSVKIGYYTPGDPADTTELFTISKSDAQTVNPTALGATTFDPGSALFGLYGMFPGTSTSNGQPDIHYSEDALNVLDTAHPRKLRFFPLKDASGNVVPNSYIVAAEDYNSTAYNSFVNFVGVISNVMPAPNAVNAAVLGLNNPIGPSTTRLSFNRVQIQNVKFGDTVHDTNTIQIINTGDKALTITSLTLSDPTNWMIVNPPTTAIAPGGTYNLAIKFIATTDPVHTGNQVNDVATTVPGVSVNAAGGVWNGTLVISSNDAVNPTRTIQLAGYWQKYSEHEMEPSLQTIANLALGYTSVLAPTQQPNFPNGASAALYGEEVSSAYWNVADPSRPVAVKDIAAWHNEQDANGNLTTAMIGYTTGVGAAATKWLFKNQLDEGQTLYPTIYGSTTTPAAGTFPAPVTVANPAGTFGFNLDGNYSDDSLNTAAINTYKRSGHQVRFFPLRDANGNIVPNTFLMAMDYGNDVNENFDYQDNVYLVSNIRPAKSAPTPTNAQAVAGAAGGVSLQWAPVSDSTLVGYNVYRSTSRLGTFTKLTSTPITMTGFFDGTAPAGATSYYKITAVDAGGEGVGATPTATAAPAAPTGLLATALGAGSIKLAWTAVPGATQYDIEREVVGGTGFVQIASIPAAATYTDTGLSANTNYVYQVRAQDNGGYSPDSQVAQTTTAVAATPSAPTGFGATLNASNQVVLTWTAPAGSIVTAYHVERKGPGQSTFSEIAGNITGLTFTDTSTVPGASYVYQVRAENSGIFGPYSPTINVSTAAQTLPQAPGTVTAIANSSSEITVTWSAVSGATSYTIQRQAVGAAGWTILTAAWTGGTTFADANVEPSTQYTYEVAAQNASGAGAFTQANATTPSGAYQSNDINAAMGATIDNIDGQSYDISAYGVDIGSTAVDSFRFVYQPLAGNFDAVVQVQSLVNTFSTAKAGLMVRASLDAGSAMVFDGATAGSSFRWLCRTAANAVPSFNSVGPNVVYPNAWVRLTRVGNLFTGYYSPDGLTWTQSGAVTIALPSTVYFGMAVTSHNTSAATTAQFRSLSILTPPAAPVLSATPASVSSITVKWNSVPTAYSYTVLRYSPAAGAYTIIAMGVTTTSYADTGLAASTAYQYEVMAVNSVGTSDPSNVSTATTLSAAVVPPAAPSGLGGNSPSSSEIDLTWSVDAGATGYSVERSSDNGQTWSNPVSTGSQTSYQDATVAPDTSYEYEVFASNGGGSSAASTPVTVVSQQIQPPVAPTILTAVSPSSKEIDITWSAPSNTSTYTLLRSFNGSAYATVAANLTTTAYQDKGVAGNSAYSYEVIANNAGGPSPASVPFGVSSLPSLTSVDIATSTTGTTNTLADDSSYDVTASGTGVYGVADSFRYVYTQVTGNFDVAVQVANITGTGVAGTYPQAGLLARASLDPAAADVGITASPVGGYRFKYRATSGAATTQTQTGTATFPSVWVRLQRVGNIFTTYYSADGMNWTKVGSVMLTTLSATNPIDIGMVVASNTSAAAVTAQFRNFTGA